MRCSWLKSGVVYAQKFCRLGVTTLPLVYGDQVEYLVVLPAMHGHADADGHVGKWSKSKCRLCVTIWVKRPSHSTMYLVTRSLANPDQRCLVSATCSVSMRMRCQASSKGKTHHTNVVTVEQRLGKLCLLPALRCRLARKKDSD